MSTANTFLSLRPMFKESYGSGDKGGATGYAAKRLREVSRERPKFKKLKKLIGRK